jgi:phosphoribosylformylglycinamidine synthase subunit PurS
MTFTAHITVMPLKELLDPQGKAVKDSLKNLSINSVQDVRIGKHITLQIDAESEEEAKQTAEEATRKLLANPVMEQFKVDIVEKYKSVAPDWDRLSKGGA